MKTVDIKCYNNSIEDMKAINVSNGDVVTILLGGVQSKKILFIKEGAKYSKDMLTKNFIEKYKLIVED